LAGTGQLYFVGMTAPIGSLSAPGSEKAAVYLRWDVVDGEMPTEISKFIVRRNGEDIAELPAFIDVAGRRVAAVMPADEIEGLYGRTEQDRRKKETIRWLDSLLDEQDNGKDDESIIINETNFAQAIHEKIDPSGQAYDAFWAHMAARMDFNVARARYRAYLDMDVPAPGTSHDYELIGVMTDGEETVLGKASVGGAVQALPAATDFRSVLLGRCDAPERYKDHGALALSWKPGDGSVMDTLAYSLVVVGYDLYRGNLPDDAIPSESLLDRNLRDEASRAEHTPDGRVFFDGLEKLNDQPITIAGDAVIDSDGDGVADGEDQCDDSPLGARVNSVGCLPADGDSLNEARPAPFFHFLRTAKEHAAEGIAPGDEHVYCLVGRDFTGNYTDTICRVIRVPDMDAPPPPRAVQVLPDSPGGALRLSWDAVTVENYYEAYGNSRVFCNLDEAKETGRLCFVPRGKTCGSGGEICVDLETKAYLVYRFDDPTVAATFQDSDGDGYSDLDEHAVTDPEHPAPVGYACSAETPDSPDLYADLPNHLVSRVDPDEALVVLPSGRRIVEFQDAGPPVTNKGDVYWYRIASCGTVDCSPGSIGRLSPPVRGMFPERTLPDAPVFCSSATDENCVRLESRRCQYVAEAVQIDSSLPFVLDTSGKAMRVEVQCTRNGIPCSEGKPRLPDGGTFYFVKDAQSGESRAYLSSAYCGVDVNGAEVTLTVFDGRGRMMLQETPLRNAANGSLCSLVGIFEDCSATGGESDPEEWGGVIGLPFELRVPVKSGERVTLYREIGGTPFRIGTFATDVDCAQDVSCDQVRIEFIEEESSGDSNTVWLPAMCSDTISLLLEVVDQNNMVSPRLRLPDFKIDLDRDCTPAEPQPLKIVFSPQESGTVRWRLPDEPVSGTLVRWRLKGGGPETAGIRFVPFVGSADTVAGRLREASMTFDITTTHDAAEDAWEEEWCFAVRSVRQSASGWPVLSEWSPELCGMRLPPAAAAPEYLPWPKIPDVPSLGRYRAFYYRPAMVGDPFPVVELTDATPVPFCADSSGRYNAKDCGRDPKSDPACQELDKERGGTSIGTSGTSIGCSFCDFLKTKLAPHMGFVVYRQSREDENDNMPEDFIQVSPLIEQVYCRTEFSTDPETDTNNIEFLLDDPFVTILKVRQQNGNSTTWNSKFVYIDRFPHIDGRQYRYQFVFFDHDGEILGYRTTNWMTATDSP